MAMLKVKYLPTGNISEVTPEAWENIKNGIFRSDFELVTPPVAPKEVTDNLEGKKDKA